MRILQLTVHFPPNLGGVETHLWDLVTLLSKKDWKVFVLCYRPLSTNVSWQIYQKNNELEILRIPWLAGLFYKFIPYPKFEFLYLFPGLFIATPIILLLRRMKIIHAHGLVAGFSAVLWGKIFNKRVIISTHSLYSFPNQGFYQSFARFIFAGADKVLCLSNKSCQEIEGLGISKSKIIKFTYWIDLNKFKKILGTKKRFDWKEKFVVLFVGRLVSEKGIEVLLQSARSWNKDIGLVIVGTGPLEEEVKRESFNNSRIHFLGKQNQDDLPLLYSAADIVIVPSTSEEGFGRVIMESLACSTPVIASSRGSIPEVLDQSVGRLIEINSNNIKLSIEDFFRNPGKLKLLAKNARGFAERRYSDKNAEIIIKSYNSEY